MNAVREKLQSMVIGFGGVTVIGNYAVERTPWGYRILRNGESISGYNSITIDEAVMRLEGAA